MRVNTGTQGCLQNPYSVDYFFKKCFNGKLRKKGACQRIRKEEPQFQEELKGTETGVWGRTKKGTRVWRELGKADVTRDPGSPEGRSSGPGPPPTQPSDAIGMRPQRASAGAPPRATRVPGPPTSPQHERRDAQPGPPRLSRALLPSLP